MTTASRFCILKGLLDCTPPEKTKCWNKGFIRYSANRSSRVTEYRVANSRNTAEACIRAPCRFRSCIALSACTGRLWWREGWQNVIFKIFVFTQQEALRVMGLLINVRIQINICSLKLKVAIDFGLPLILMKRRSNTSVLSTRDER